MKDGDLLWRRRDVDRFRDAADPQKAAAAFNGRFADRPVIRRRHGKLTVSIGVREFQLAEAIEIIETGENPSKLTCGGNPYREDIFIGQGPLGSLLKQECDALGLNYDDLTVLTRKNDPFRHDTAARHRDASWFAEHFNQHVAPLRTIHLRGFHYILVSAGGVLKPDGSRYSNNEADYNWMNEIAAKAARWLGYVGFDQIH